MNLVRGQRAALSLQATRPERPFHFGFAGPNLGLVQAIVSGRLGQGQYDRNGLLTLGERQQKLASSLSALLQL